MKYFLFKRRFNDFLIDFLFLGMIQLKSKLFIEGHDLILGE